VRWMCVCCHAAAACREAEHEGEGDSVTKLHEDLSGESVQLHINMGLPPHALRCMCLLMAGMHAISGFLQLVAPDTRHATCRLMCSCHWAPSAALPQLQMRSTLCCTRSTAAASRPARRAAVTRSRTGRPMAARVRGGAGPPCRPMRAAAARLLVVVAGPFVLGLAAMLQAEAVLMAWPPCCKPRLFALLRSAVGWAGAPCCH
jgi:hypothetical protein